MTIQDVFNALAQSLAAIFAVANAILSSVSKVLTLADNIAFGPNTQTTVTAIQDPSTGLVAIENRLATFQATTAIDVTAILTAIAATQQAGSPVTLPTTTPAGGTWVDAGNLGSGVWDYTRFGPDVHPYDNLQQAGLWFNFLEGYGIGPQVDDWVWVSDWFPKGNSGWTITYPVHNPNNILPTDTLLSWLARENPTFTVYNVDGYTGRVGLIAPPGPDLKAFTTLMDEADFVEYKAGLFPGMSLNAAPIWPGASGVTIGSPVAISDGLVVAGPLAGILLDITGVAPPISFYPFGSIKSYVRAGAVIFTTDSGDSEFAQPFGPEDEIILPKTMVTASSATLRVTSGVVGTVRAFTIP